MSASPGPGDGSPPSPISPLTLAKDAAPRTNYFSYKGESPRLHSIPEHVKPPSEENISNQTLRNKSGSFSSVSFQLDGDEAETVRGQPKAHRKERIKTSSPPPQSRFKPHVSFDNFSGAEPTESNTIAFTLNVKHTGYQYKRRSRTFMVGIDENEYSDTALKWLLDELIDDGDEIVCVRVIDPDAKVVSSARLESKQYQDEAQVVMKKVQDRNDHHRAISIVLEFAVGKLHTTFQKMINIYEPAMLIVGTKGRSLGGLQGLMSNRTSFSKWCLQYSPIPVVVVRPSDKRLKKKNKRANDPERHNYKQILENSGSTVHETNAKPGGSFEKVGTLTLSQDQEAHAVAKALGLAEGEIEAVIGGNGMQPVFVPGIEGRRGSESDGIGAMIIPPGSKIRTDSPSVSDEESEDDDEPEFDVTPGSTLVGRTSEGELGEAQRRLREEEEEAALKKERLHNMEVKEAQTLVSGSYGSTGRGMFPRSENAKDEQPRQKSKKEKIAGNPEGSEEIEGASDFEGVAADNESDGNSSYSDSERPVVEYFIV